MFTDEITPNSKNFVEFVNRNVMKPIAVVTFVNHMAVPVFRITCVNALILFPCCLNSK